MKNKTKTIIGVVAVIIIIVAAVAYYSTRENKEGQNVEQEEVEAVLPSGTQALSARHSFVAGKHIVAGEVKVPTPCVVLETAVRIAESFPEQVTIDFTATSDGEICAQVIDTRRFKVEFDASENATIKATWNGKPIELNLLKASASALEAFNIFVKG